MAEYPQLNYCPQCATPLEDREAFGRIRRYCPACDLLIFQDPKVAAAVLVERDGRVLLVRKAYGRAKGRWSLPAGFVEYDEDPAAAAVRECREETGLEVELTGLLDVLPGAGPPGEASFTIVYRGKIVGGELRARDDADRAAFFSVDDLPPLAYESTRRALARWRETARRSACGEE
ncbi:MAG: NUDIX domain-containing protein [Anaerolineae bacterium]|nr:NUDIX domain-containing protein [Anaerolineae bacterium]MDW7992404.1 NUDIX domain-containing protein [Anaerolineae bacterium]